MEWPGAYPRSWSILQQIWMELSEESVSEEGARTQKMLQKHSASKNQTGREGGEKEKDRRKEEVSGKPRSSSAPIAPHTHQGGCRSKDVLRGRD